MTSNFGFSQTIRKNLRRLGFVPASRAKKQYDLGYYLVPRRRFKSRFIEGDIV
jgi:hypothetical protein